MDVCVLPLAGPSAAPPLLPSAIGDTRGLCKDALGPSWGAWESSQGRQKDSDGSFWKGRLLSAHTEEVHFVYSRFSEINFCSCRRKSGWLQVQAQNEGISVVTENLSWSLLCRLLWSLDRARAREKLKEQSEIALEDCLCSMLIEFTEDKAVCHVLRCGCLGR